MIYHASFFFGGIGSLFYTTSFSVRVHILCIVYGTLRHARNEVCMHTFIPRALLVLGALFALGLFLFIGGQILTLSEIATRFNPLLGECVFWGGMGTFALAIGWLLAAYYMRPRAMILKKNASEEEITQYTNTLIARIRKSRYAKENPIPDNADAAEILERLDAEAIKETRRTAARIFISTSISQNGKLDTLIVLALLAHLVWRIASIYNNRPHPREMLHLYLNVAGTALAAGALEEVGLEEHIHALLAPLLISSPMSAIPTLSGASAMLTASLVSGSANALLALRVGIVTRNTLSPILAGMEARPNPYREAAGLLGHMSKSLVRKVVKATFAGFATEVNAKARSAVTAVCSGTKNTVNDMTSAVRGTTRATVQGLSDAAHSVGTLAARTGTLFKPKTAEAASLTEHTPEKKKKEAIIPSYAKHRS